MRPPSQSWEGAVTLLGTKTKEESRRRAGERQGYGLHAFNRGKSACEERLATAQQAPARHLRGQTHLRILASNLRAFLARHFFPRWWGGGAATRGLLE